jgi:predicted RNA-binding Zn ribbon-like protein
VGAITDDEAQKASHRANRKPGEAGSAHRRAIELRETVYRIFTIILEGQSPAREDLALFNNYLSEAMTRSRIVKTRGGYHWDMTADKENLDWILNPVIRSAADLLVSEEIRQVKRCADPTCGWLFLDISRNRSRRWCDMADCGNRAKASRFYKKNKGSNTFSSSPKTRSTRSKPKTKIKRHLL